VACLIYYVDADNTNTFTLRLEKKSGDI